MEKDTKPMETEEEKLHKVTGGVTDIPKDRIKDYMKNNGTAYIPKNPLTGI